MPNERPRVLAVLGPTNTGKTHFAVERMLAHPSGLIGFPLRLLAREIYDRIVALRGAAAVALITGEEKITPPSARYVVATVEAMPQDRRTSFLAVDEIQLCADPERGHVFTDRLLRARGRDETIFLGADTIRPLLKLLVPEAEVITRPRFSTLTYTAPVKVTRLPKRSAAVAFTAQDVYALAELVRRQRGGAAVVLGVMGALPSLAPRVAVTGYCALAENMPSGSAQRPGDVFAARNGKTVQVLNTDAEGRLVMADALSLAAETDADAILDVATLTGAVSHAVGRRAVGVFGNDDDLLRQVLAAAEDAGESAWHLPLWEDLREGLESDVADLDNIAREDRGGATIAGLFLREFVDDVPWVHLDVAGAMWATQARGHLPSQATGVGVRTILRWLEATHG